MNNQNSSAKLKMVVSTVAFGTVGIFRRYITLPSCVLAMARGLIGATFLVLVILITRKGVLDKAGIKKNLIKLVMTGALIGFNWIALFEAYNYTSVSKATLYYYTAPLFLILISIVFLKEKADPKKLICVVIALFGVALVSGIFEGQAGGSSEAKGLVYGLAASIMYATVMSLNKSVTGVEATDKTMIQIGTAGLVMIPYSALTGAFSGIELSTSCIVMTLILGAFHTGFCYTLFFGAMDSLSGQSIAIFTYIDPAVAVILSAVILKEKLTLFGLIGAVLVIGAALLSELNLGTKIGDNKKLKKIGGRK